MMMFSSEFKQGTTARRHLYVLVGISGQQEDTENMCTCRSSEDGIRVESGVMEHKHNRCWSATPLQREE